MKSGSPVILHRNWRGLFAFSTDTSGELTTCTPTETTGCKDFPWPARAPWSYWYDPHVKDTHLWYGTLPLDQADETGLSYRRNRYYDGLSGQFTQEDPIGIAGGLNLYGYAGGDPINFSDPFGLCVEEDDPDDECPVIEAAHEFWQNVASAGVEEGGVTGLAKEITGNVASALLDFGGVTTIDAATTTLADPSASAAQKLLAGGQTALVVAGAGITGKVAAAGVRVSFPTSMTHLEG